MWIVGIAHHPWANRSDEAFLYCEGIIIAEEGLNPIVRQTARVFGEGLRGDTEGGDFETSFFVAGFGLPEELERVLNFGLVVRAVEPHERSDRANLGLRRRVEGIRRKSSRGNQAARRKHSGDGQHARAMIAGTSHENAAIPVMRSPMISLWMSWVPS